MSIFAVIAGIIMAGYFYRLARINNQNTASWAVAGFVSFFIGYFIWYFLFFEFIGLALLRIIPSVPAIVFIGVITMYVAGYLVAVWVRDLLLRRIGLTPAPHPAG